MGGRKGGDGTQRSILFSFIVVSPCAQRSAWQRVGPPKNLMSGRVTAHSKARALVPPNA